MAGRRRRSREEHDNHERWLISYADFLTLLFAFFVVMYAISSLNEEKYRVFSQSVSIAFNKEQAASAVPPLIPAISAQQQELSTVAENLGKLKELMRPMIEQGDVSVNQTKRGITINVSASLLFQTGEAEIQPQALFVLEQIATILSLEIHPIEVEGHTDDVPINTQRYPSNWELSSARASSVVRLLVNEGVDAKQLSVVGLADTQPLVANTSPENRARNRRVSITILSSIASR